MIILGIRLGEEVIGRKLSGNRRSFWDFCVGDVSLCQNDQKWSLCQRVLSQKWNLTKTKHSVFFFLLLLASLDHKIRKRVYV